MFNDAIAEATSRQAALPIEWDDTSHSLTIAGSTFDLPPRRNIYAIAIGKAALYLAVALDAKLREKLTAGVVAAPETAGKSEHLSRWRTFAAGHPLPNQESLAAAEAAFTLLEKANREEAVVIFLVSGGGSAAIEWPGNNRITLEDLRTANSLLISCGANIGEINAVRRAFSAVKGGKLAARAPRANQITLIVSDVNRGEESNVASGPTVPPQPNAPDSGEVVARYGLSSSLPASIMAVVRDAAGSTAATIQDANYNAHVLVDNRSVVEAAAEQLRARQMSVEVAWDICEQPIVAGCELLLARVNALSQPSDTRPAFIVSGGEFSCSVRGNGIGGRNLETALRCAIELGKRPSSVRIGQHAIDGTDHRHIVLLSAGTDGVDGNSPAAGAIVDETTIARGLSLGLDAEAFLNNSDAFNYFNALGDAIITGPTGTNVRDLRIILVSGGR